MRVLVATVDAGGNMPPTAAVVRELVGRGHEVRVLAHEAQLRDLTTAGASAQGWDSPRPWDPRPARPGARSMLSWLGLAPDPGYGRDLEAAAREGRPDVVLVDCMIPGSLRGARGAGVPVALLVHAFSDYWRDQWAGRGPMALWQRARGCSPLQPDNVPDLFLLTTSVALDGARRLRGAAGGRVAQVGSVLPGTTRPTPDDRARGPLVVSLSTLGYPGQRQALQRVLDAVAGLDVPVVATVANEADRRGLRVPPGATVHGFVPHHELFSRARAVVGHGGHATTMLALAHDLPVMILPMSRYTDQPLVGKAVESAGAGLVRSRDATGRDLGLAARQLLTPGLASGAAAVGRRLRRGDAAADAADVLQELARRGRAG